MALTSTMYVCAIELADMDRDVYESLEVRLAMHPSESPEYLVTRLLAYACEYTEGLEFSRGISTPDEPALCVRDLTGRMQTWIDIGAPDAARLHRASKVADRVVVYSHRDMTQLLPQWSGQRIHRAEAVEVYALNRSLVDALAARLERRMAFALTITERQLYAALETVTLEGALTRHPLPS
ncbi:MAG: YaeQ family protein [Acidobacteria bacterium]|nr:YaeQ family protein [Acidobacteriota bacterium]